MNEPHKQGCQPPKRLLRDQNGVEMLMTCIATFPMSEAASAAQNKDWFIKTGKSVHVLKQGKELHLYRAAKDIVFYKSLYRNAVKL